MRRAAPILLLATIVHPAFATETFEMSVGGSAYATEVFDRTERPDGAVLSGKVSLKFEGTGDATLTQDTRLARDGHPVSYVLEIVAPGQQVVLRANPSASGYAMSITPKGATEPAQSRDVAAKAPAFLLDNNFASHLDALTRAITDLGAGEERMITAVVPQVLRTFSGSVKRGADGRGTQGGAPIGTRTYHLVVANVGTELVARAGDGALLRADVPLQQVTLKRRGFESAGLASESGSIAATSDPRETATEVKGSAGALPATLLLPKSDAPAAAVLFLSGSGPNDKDETIGPNKPFADVARGLGDRKIASLRFDKRTHAIKDKSKLGIVLLKDEYDDDALAALAMLRATAGVDATRIFIVGHSEGAMVAPRVAASAPGLRGIVMMAPGVRPLDAMLIDQMEDGAKLAGRSPDEIAEQTKGLRETFAAIRDPKRTDAPPFMGASAAYWREVLALDVPTMVRDAKLPILVLQGDKDAQVRKDADFELLRTRVGDAGGRVTYRSFPSLNHLFIRVEGRSTGAEYGLPGHVDPAVIAAIADWILGH